MRISDWSSDVCSSDLLVTADILQDRFIALMMKGGKPIRRLERPHEERPYLTPALIDMTDATDRLDEELFGPVLQLVRVKDFDAAIDEANRSEEHTSELQSLMRNSYAVF